MMADDQPKKDRACSQCGRLESEHALLNFSDGPQVGQPVLVCPKVLFVPMGNRK
jgi:hypothetical protein